MGFEINRLPEEDLGSEIAVLLQHFPRRLDPGPFAVVDHVSQFVPHVGAGVVARVALPVTHVNGSFGHNLRHGLATRPLSLLLQ